MRWRRSTARRVTERTTSTTTTRSPVRWARSSTSARATRSSNALEDRARRPGRVGASNATKPGSISRRAPFSPSHPERTNMKFKRTQVAAAIGLGGVALLATSPATAQDIRVNVTGTNIKRVDTETAAPIETISREDIQQSGYQTIQDVVRQITANNNGSISPSFTNGFSASGTAVSLRGLGPNNTLVLLNGRRM